MPYGPTTNNGHDRPHLWTSVAPADLVLLLAEFLERVDHINQALEVTIHRLEGLEETLARDRAEVREAVLRSGEQCAAAARPHRP